MEEKLKLIREIEKIVGFKRFSVSKKSTDDRTHKVIEIGKTIGLCKKEETARIDPKTELKKTEEKSDISPWTKEEISQLTSNTVLIYDTDKKLMTGYFDSIEIIND